MLGGKNKQPLGYTIVEVMIVLAVSGVMFLIAAEFIGGKQARTSFTEGVNDTASQIQDVIEQVADGRYSDVPVTCTSDGTHFTINSTSPTNTQGTNSTCVFLGKFILFTSNNSSNYAVYSLAGAADPPDPTNLYVDPIASFTVNATVSQNLSVTAVYLDSVKSDGFGFIQSENTTASGNGGQTINLVSGTGSVSGGYTVSPINNAVVCLTDGTRYAQVSVGNNTNSAYGLSVNVTMNDTTEASPCNGS